MKKLKKRTLNAPDFNPRITPWRSQSSAIELRQILVPIDFSECSYNALRYALAFARQSGAGIILLHVVRLYPVDYVFGEKSAREENGWLVEQTQAQLAQLGKESAGPNQIQIKTMVRLGRPFREIAKVAKEQQVDLIITGTHGFTGIQHLQLGSTAEKVIRYAPCPVMVVHGQEKEFIAAAKNSERVSEAGGATLTSRLRFPCQEPPKSGCLHSCFARKKEKETSTYETTTSAGGRRCSICIPVVAWVEYEDVR